MRLLFILNFDLWTPIKKKAQTNKQTNKKQTIHNVGVYVIIFEALTVQIV